jgi:hypothetical protein
MPKFLVTHADGSAEEIEALSFDLGEQWVRFDDDQGPKLVMLTSSLSRIDRED